MIEKREFLHLKPISKHCALEYCKVYLGYLENVCRMLLLHGIAYESFLERLCNPEGCSC